MRANRPAAPSLRVAGVVARVLAAACVALVLLLTPSAAQAAGSVQLSKVGGKQKPTTLVTFKGKAGKRTGAKVTIQRKNGGSWTVIAKGRTGKRGTFALTWITPPKSSAVTVRAALGGSVSSPRSFRVLKPAKGAKRIKVSPKTRIISASTVESIPAGGQAGTVTYAGGNDAAPGQIMVVGQGAATPDGFIGKVTKVAQKDGDTVVTTVPTTLLEAVPEGSVNLVTQRATASAARGRRSGAASITCEGSVGASITHDITFTAGLDLKGSWTILGGLQSASLTASAGVNASVKAALAAAGSCSLGQRALLTAKGPSISGFVGPVPVVMTSKLTVYLDANASAKGSLSTGASAGFDASAGVAWTKAAGFSGVQSFTPKFSFDPPTLSASASAAVNITPTVDVLLYGIVGPRIALRTGVEFNADIAQNPWWSLDVPVDLTASISIAPLNLTSPELHVYQRSFPIADAGGGFGVPPAPPAPVVNVPSLSANIATGYDQSCTLRGNGGVACWGGNAHGQIGNGTKNVAPKPVNVSGITDAVALAAGNQHTCALRTAGGVLCWGANNSGQLGNAAAGDQTVPVPVTGITNATAIAAASQHTCALLSTGRVTCWGATEGPQVGSGSATPAQVSGVTGATAIATGPGGSACAVIAGGAVTCWGNNSNGQLGNGTDAASNTPVQVGGVTGATNVSVGAGHACAVLTTGGVSCWGANTDGQLGDGSKQQRPSAALVPGVTNANGVSAGFAHTCAKLSTGALQCWGNNEWGEVGNGTRPTDSLSPVTVSGITTATGVATGFEHTCALLTSGALQCWGYGVDGELGDDQRTTSATPVNVIGLP